MFHSVLRVDDKLGVRRNFKEKTYSLICVKVLCSSREECVDNPSVGQCKSEFPWGANGYAL